MNIFVLITGLHLKGSIPVEGIGIVPVSITYPDTPLNVIRNKINLFVSLIYGKVASPVLCPGLFILGRIYRILFTVADGGQA